MNLTEEAKMIYQAQPTAYNARALQVAICLDALDWQPEETAPKDGTLIFAYINLTPEQENMTLAPTIVYWSRSEDLAEPCFVEPYSDKKLKAPLIHWMPLPEPPK